MNVTPELVLQAVIVLGSAGGTLYKLGEKLKQAELDRQADTARLENMIRDIGQQLAAHIARAEERHASSVRRLDDHQRALEINNKQHDDMRAKIEEHGRQLAKLGA